MNGLEYKSYKQDIKIKLDIEQGFPNTMSSWGGP